MQSWMGTMGCGLEDAAQFTLKDEQNARKFVRGRRTGPALAASTASRPRANASVS